MALPRHRLVLARGPFVKDAEVQLMQDERIDMLVSKNSGGSSTYAKIEAARTLGVSVVMVRRPKPPEAETLSDLDAVMTWIGAHRGAP